MGILFSVQSAAPMGVWTYINRGRRYGQLLSDLMGAQGQGWPLKSKGLEYLLMIQEY